MTNRSQFYISKELDFGRPSAARGNSADFFGNFTGYARSIFLGFSVAFMFSIYGACVLYFLDQLDAPLPAEVSTFVAEAEFQISQFLSDIKQARYR